MFVALALDFNRTDRDAEADANARLIAAAPELLGMFRTSIKLIRTYVRLSSQVDTAWLEAAEALIRKAEGE